VDGTGSAAQEPDDQDHWHVAHLKPWHDRWRPRSRHTISLKLGLQQEPSGDAGYASWQGGGFTKSDNPQGKEPFCQATETLMINMGQMVPECSKLPDNLSPPLRQAPRCSERPRGDLQGAWQRLVLSDLAALSKMPGSG